MKKNTLVKLLAVLVMCFMIGAVLVACDAGEPGKDGAPGADGKDGSVVTIIDVNGVKYWAIDGENTGVKAEGKDGVNATDCDNHDWTQKTHVLQAHTETTVGKILVVCANCGDADIIVDDHKYDEVVAIFAATADAEGYVVVKCDCGKIIDVALPVLGDASYNVTKGNCITPDTYAFTINKDQVTVSGSFEVVVAYDHVPAAEFDADNIADCWIKSIEDLEDGICVCELKPEYTTECINGCGYVFHELGNAPGHVWGEYKPGTNDTDACDCEWIPVDIAECTVCDCDECIDHKIVGAAKGHVYGEWNMIEKPTLEKTGSAISACVDCAGKDNCIITLELPALTEWSYDDAVKAPTCDTKGLTVYTYVLEDGSTFEIEGELPELGHTFDANCATVVTKVPTATTEGAVSVTCSVCGKSVTYALPVLGDAAYDVANGDCINKDDTYTITIKAAGLDDGEFKVEFTVNGGYVHENQAGHVLVEVTDEETGNKYYVYKCSICGSWIVADFVKPEA